MTKPCEGAFSIKEYRIPSDENYRDDFCEQCGAPLYSGESAYRVNIDIGCVQPGMRCNEFLVCSLRCSTDRILFTIMGNECLIRIASKGI